MDWTHIWISNACVDYKNTSGIGYPYNVSKSVNWVLKLLPNFRITMKPPKYNGLTVIKTIPSMKIC